MQASSRLLASRLLAGLTLGAALLCTGGAQAGGIPVVDLAAIEQAVQEVLNSAEQIGNQVRQITQLQQQIGQLQSQYQAVTGMRNLGAILDNPTLRNYIPADATQVVSAIASTGYPALGGSAKALRDAQMVYNCLDLGDSGARVRCQSSLAMPYQQKAFMQDAMQTASGRIAQIQSLMRQIDATQDPKAIAEIQARLDAENAMLQHQQTQIGMARGLAEAEYRIAESRAREAQLQQASRSGRLADFVSR